MSRKKHVPTHHSALEGLANGNLLPLDLDLLLLTGLAEGLPLARGGGGLGGGAGLGGRGLGDRGADHPLADGHPGAAGKEVGSVRQKKE